MATLRDIAEKAGVSIGTVDRVLHKRGRFSPETARRVHQIIREIGYKPNLMARRLSDSRSCRIGVLLPFPQQDSGYWSLPLRGIRRAADELEPFGLTLSISHYNRYQDNFSQAAARLLETRPDGILMAPLPEQSTREFLGELPPDIPVIFFDTDLPGVRRTAYIGQDSYQSGRLGARLLQMLINGKTGAANGNRVLLVSPDTENEHLKNRIRGFLDGSICGVEILKVSVESDLNREHFFKQLEYHLETQPRNSGKAPVNGIFVCDASSHFVADYLAGRKAASAESAAPAAPAASTASATPAASTASAAPAASTASATPAASTASAFSTAYAASTGYVPALVGYDLVRENRYWLEQGVIDFLLTQRPADQGYSGVNRLFRKIFLDEDGPENEYTPIDIVTRENMKYLSAETGE